MARVIPHSPLDDPANASHAWGQFRRLMRIMSIVTVILIVIAVLLLYFMIQTTSVHFYIATILGVGFTMMLMSGLMGLVFLSHGTGHDDAIADLIGNEYDE